MYHFKKFKSNKILSHNCSNLNNYNKACDLRFEIYIERERVKFITLKRKKRIVSDLKPLNLLLIEKEKK